MQQNGNHVILLEFMKYLSHLPRKPINLKKSNSRYVREAFLFY